MYSRRPGDRGGSYPIPAVRGLSGEPRCAAEAHPCHDQGWTLLTGGGRSLKYRPPRVPEIRPIEYVRPGSSVGSGLIALRPSSGRGMGATVHGTGYGQRTPEPPGQPLRCCLRQARRGSCPWTRARTRPSQAAPAPRAGCRLRQAVPEVLFIGGEHLVAHVDAAHARGRELRPHAGG